MPKLIFGCGYLGHRVARGWLAQGETVYAVTRNTRRAAVLQQDGIQPIVADVTSPEALVAQSSLASLPACETVLYAVGHDRSTGGSMRQVHVEGLANVLERLPPGVERFIYISTTGVHGSSDGAWVDEQTACRPVSEGGRVRLEAEHLLQQSPLGGRSVILRMAGLYGPGRLPRQADLLAGRPIPVPGDGWLNLVHVDDAAAVVLTAEAHAAPPALYLVSDGQPTSRRAYLEELARLLQAPPPHFTQPAPEAGTSRPAGETEPSAGGVRGGGSKRISHRKLVEQLGYRFLYPSYREGLAAIVE